MFDHKATAEKRRRSGQSPTRIIVCSFVIVIATGTLLLMLPWSTHEGISLLDAFFTATSATCVTGLVVVDTYSAFTPFGQGVVLCLIQVGGLGLVTLTSFFTLFIRRRMGFRSLQVASESISASSLEQVRALLRTVMRVAFLCEGIGAVLLSFVFVPMYQSEGIWISVFLSISAFCNAGFDILGRIAPFTSITTFTGNWYVQGILMALIVSGGLGFIVWQELAALRRTHHLSLHSKVVLTGTAFLIVSGTLAFALLEWNHVLAGMDTGDKVVASLFQSISARTCGFNSVDLAQTTLTTRMMMCILMFIGAAPAGTGGGIKVTTFSVLMVTVLSVIKGKEDATIFGRRINKSAVYRSLSIAILCLIAVLTAAVTIFFNTGAQINEFNSLFEAVSAFGTVGLSVGATSVMEPAAKLITILTMFIGRVGPVSLAISLSLPDGDSRSKWEVLPEGKITVG